MEEITSTHNQKIKEIVALQEKSKLRRQNGLFVVEGEREVTACINNGFTVESLLINSEISNTDISGYLRDISIKHPDIKLYSLTKSAYSKIAYRESTEGIIAIVKEKKRNINNIVLKNRFPIVLVCEKIEKPGNLGALLRTADACGLDAVISCSSLTDIYNPNVIRASIGAIFTKQVVTCANEEALKWLRTYNFNIFTAQLQDSQFYYSTDMKCACAIVVGNEAEGLSNFWRAESDAKIKIPMLGEMDSLNVSISAAVLCYEAVRQRAKDKTSNK